MAGKKEKKRKMFTTTIPLFLCPLTCKELCCECQIEEGPINHPQYSHTCIGFQKACDADHQHDCNYGTPGPTNNNTLVQ